MASCDTIEVDLTPVNLDVAISNPAAFDVEIVQPDVVIEGVSMAGMGPQGDAATIAVGTTTTGIPGDPASVTNVGDQHAAIFNFSIPTGNNGPPGSPGSKGDAATIAAGTATSLPAGSSPTVSNSGTSNAAVFDFGIPIGNTGATGPQGPAGPPTGPHATTHITGGGDVIPAPTSAASGLVP